MQIKTFYRNNLPHFTPIGATFFVTFRLADALPQSILWKMKREFNEKIEQIKRENPKDILKIVSDEQKRFFGKYDKQLDCEPYGKCWLKQQDIAEIVRKRMHENDGVLYDLQAYTIMPNHVHLLIDTKTQFVNKNHFYLPHIPLKFKALSDIMQLIKGGASYKSNLLLQKQIGKKVLPFFQRESFDRFVRNEKEWQNIIAYILNNPVKAGLIENWQDWEYSYCKDIYLGN